MIKRDKKGRFIKGERNISWKGGKSYDGQGYIKIWKPKHPLNNHGYVLEQRLVMEKKLGRYLRVNEIVHHINHIKNDNRATNLIVFTRQIHPSQIHLKGKKRPIEIGKKISKSLIGHKVSNKTKEKQRQAKLKNPTRYWLGRSRDPRLKRDRDRKGRFSK